MDKILNSIKGFFKSRNLRYGSNSFLLIAAVVVIAVFANILIGMTDLKVDLTSNKLYSLSDVTKNLLSGLKSDVTITGLFDDGAVGSSGDGKDLTDILVMYQKYSHVKVKYVDPDKNPGVIKLLDPDSTMNLQKSDFVVSSIVNGKEKKKVLSSSDLFAVQTDQSTFQQTETGSNAEQGFTGAIKYVTSPKTPVAYFIVGHSEIDVNSEYTNVKKVMDQNNYEVKTLNLVTAGKVPDDAALLVVASPKGDLMPSEKDAIKAYLSNGGNAVFMFDYLPNDPNLDQFNNLLSGYNLAVNYDKIKETDANKHDPSDPYTILLNVNASAIIPQAFNTVLGNSRSISILKNAKQYITATTLMQTSDTAVGEQVSKSRGADNKGPLDIAIAVDNQGGSKPSKVLVMGNASFISDAAEQAYSSYYNNSMAFFIQSVGWMLGAQTDDLNLPTKNYNTQQINITAMQAGVVGGALVIIFPLIILCVGLFVFLRRRHL